MKTLKNFFTLLNLNLLLVALATSDRTYQLRSNRNLSASQKSNSCKLYWKYGATEKGETESLDCEIMSEGKLFRLPLLGLSDEWLRLHKDEIVSGESILVTWKLDIDDDLVGLHVRDEREFNGHTFLDNGQQQHKVVQTEHKTKTKKNHDRRLLSRSKGRKRTVVVHIQAKDSSSKFSPNDLRNHVFGANGSGDSVRSQLKDCSYNQFEMIPSNVRGVVNGVYRMNLNVWAKGKHHNFVTNKALEQLRNKYGSDLTRTFDHVMICVPEEVKSFVAYAWGNDFLSVYHGDWCKSFSANIHELGHNMGLQHAGEGDCQGCKYADQSGMMGYVYPLSYGPQMCYNGPQSWQLGWYESKSVTINPIQYPWYGELVGIAEYGEIKYNQRYQVILKIDAPKQDIAFFVHFNRKIGMNGGTREGADQVLVISQVHKNGRPGVTNLIAKLNPGDQHVLKNFNKSGEHVTIRVNQILEKGGFPWSAAVTVESSTPSPTSSPTALPTVHPIQPQDLIVAERHNNQDQSWTPLIFSDMSSGFTSTSVDCKILGYFQCSENKRNCNWNKQHNICQSKRYRGRTGTKSERSSDPRDRSSASWD